MTHNEEKRAREIVFDRQKKVKSWRASNTIVKKIYMVYALEQISRFINHLYHLLGKSDFKKIFFITTGFSSVYLYSFKD